MKRRISECYTIGFDLSEDKDLSAAVVLLRESESIKQINLFTGEDAEELYKTLTNIKNT